MTENMLTRRWFDIKGSLPQKSNVNLKDGCIQLLGIICCQPLRSCCLSGLKSITKTFLPASSSAISVSWCLLGIMYLGPERKVSSQQHFPKICNAAQFSQKWEGECFEEWLNMALDFVVTDIRLYIISTILRLRDFLTLVYHTNWFSLAVSEDCQDTAWIELGQSGEMAYPSSGSSQGKVEIPEGISWISLLWKEFFPYACGKIPCTANCFMWAGFLYSYSLFEKSKYVTIFIFFFFACSFFHVS